MAVKKGKTENKKVANDIVEERVNIQSTPMANSDSEMMELIKKLQNKIENLETKSNKPTGTEAEQYDEEVLDDWLEKPVSFFTWSSRYSLHGDFRRGKHVKTPSGSPIVFNVAIRQKKRVGKEDQIVCVAKHTTQSKSTLEFLRNHSEYGTIIFEDLRAVKDIDPKRAQDLQDASTRVRTMSDIQVVSMSRTRGIEITTDTQKMRYNLIQNLAGEERNKKEQLTRQVAENASTDAQGNRKATELDMSGAASSGVGNVNPY